MNLRKIHLVEVVVSLGFLLPLLGAAPPLRAQTTSNNPYRATFSWEQLPEGRTLGIVSGVIPDPDGEHLWILDRCGANQCAGTDLDPILKFDLDGNLVDSYGAGMFAFPHGFALDREGYLWVTEGGAHGDARGALGESMGMGHQIFKLTRQGEVVMTIGEAGMHGDDETHFNGPSGVAIAPSGDIWVADGHRGGNNRIVKLTSNGTFVLAVGGGVGSESREPARFSDPHDIKIDSRGRRLRRRPGQQPHPGLRRRRRPALHLDAVRQAQRPLHRRERHPVRGRRPLG